jgi:enhancing lycopene biosynthesis protein 2
MLFNNDIKTGNNTINRRNKKMKTGVLLSGSGVMDGSEIHEAVLTLLHLDRKSADILCLAPDDKQTRITNHVSNEIIKIGERNMMIESARIARGDIKEISTIKADDIDTLILPGGFGAAVNLCSFAVDGPSCSVRPDVARLINDMINTKKPVGALCIAPALIARILGKRGIPARVTIGNDQETADAINKMGAVHVDCPVNKAVIDSEHNIVTSPAYMLAKSIKDVDESVKALIEGIFELLA